MPSTRSGALGATSMSVHTPLMHSCVSLQVAAQGAASMGTQVERDGSPLGMPLTMAGVMQALVELQRPAHEIGVESTTLMLQSLADGLSLLAVATRSSEVKWSPAGMPLAT